MAVSQPKMVQFSFCKKGLEARNALCHMQISLGAVNSSIGMGFYKRENGITKFTAPLSSQLNFDRGRPKIKTFSIK